MLDISIGDNIEGLNRCFMPKKIQWTTFCEWCYTKSPPLSEAVKWLSKLMDNKLEARNELTKHQPGGKLITRRQGTTESAEGNRKMEK